MTKSLLLGALLLATTMSASAQTTFKKLPAKMQLMKQKSAKAKVMKADAAATSMNTVAASYYTSASDATNNQDNYYLVISDNSNAVYNSTSGSIDAKDATVASIDFYAPASTGTTLPTGTYKADGSTLNYETDYSSVSYYNANGKPTNARSVKGDVVVTKNSDNTYNVSFADANGNAYTYSGTLSFIDAESSSAVYPQLTTDVNTTFTGGMAFYHGNLMQANTGNMYINLYDCDFDPETGGMNSKGFNLSICAFNRLFGDSKKATIVPGTYNVARNFHSETYFPGMEIDYSGVTIIMGTYVKRLKSGAGSDGDYDYGYITSGTIVITEGDTEGTFNFDIDCTTDRGHKVKGTAKNISFNIIDVSDDDPPVVESNLDRDVTLNFDYLTKARAYYIGRTNGCNLFTIDLGSPSGKDCTEGDILRMEFQASTDKQYLPSGTYQLMDEDHLHTNLYSPYMMTRGYFDNVGGRTGTRYEHFATGRYCVVDTFAFVYSGSVGVEALENDEYKFHINVYDGRGYLISGEWSGPVELCYDPATSIGAVSDDKKVAVCLNGNMLSVAGANEGETMSVYSVDGQLALSADATKSVDASQLKGGVYIVKVGNRMTTKIVKK